MAQTPTVIGISSEMTNFTQQAKSMGQRVGFVPTMGALHEGHISLVKEARENCDLVVVSIFVNPTQFNDPKDFERYPRTVDNDLALLAANGCDVVFIPETVSEVYPSGYQSFTLPLGNLENVMEGKHRPGHFNGVINVVSRLFEIVEPDDAYFGLKDYQQYLVVNQLIVQKKYPIQLHGRPTSRTGSGLARSSRNTLLSEEERTLAAEIYRILSLTRDQLNILSVEELEEKALAEFREHPEFEVEYFEIADGDTLESLNGKGSPGKNPMAFVALRLGKVRLIDNMFLKN
ncbi:MAG: pantoate--beta-alanine ligase [Bacteroidota bacterium]